MKSSLICAVMVVIGTWLSSVAKAQVVVCSEPYETSCPFTDNVFACALIPCETNMDPDPQAYPVVCPQGATEEIQTNDTYHLGLQAIGEPNKPGYFYFWNQEVLCSKSRLCSSEQNCTFDPAGFFCPANDPMAPWTLNKELFYVGVDGEECEVVEEL